MNPVIKIGLSALLIFVISEIAKRYSFAGSLVASVPIISVLSMIWIYHDTHDVERIATFSREVFLLVIPSLVLFVSLPLFLIKYRMQFYTALSLSIAATVLSYFLMTLAMRKFGISN